MKPADLLPADVRSEELDALDAEWRAGACRECLGWPCACGDPCGRCLQWPCVCDVNRHAGTMPEPTRDDVIAAELHRCAPGGAR